MVHYFHRYFVTFEIDAPPLGVNGCAEVLRHFVRKGAVYEAKLSRHKLTLTFRPPADTGLKTFDEYCFQLEKEAREVLDRLAKELGTDDG